MINVVFAQSCTNPYGLPPGSSYTFFFNLLVTSNANYQMPECEQGSPYSAGEGFFGITYPAYTQSYFVITACTEDFDVDIHVYDTCGPEATCLAYADYDTNLFYLCNSGDPYLSSELIYYQNTGDPIYTFFDEYYGSALDGSEVLEFSILENQAGLSCYFSAILSNGETFIGDLSDAIFSLSDYPYLPLCDYYGIPDTPAFFFNYVSELGNSVITIDTTLSNQDTDIHVFDGCLASSVCLLYVDFYYDDQYDAYAEFNNDNPNSNYLIVVDQYFAVAPGTFYVTLTEKCQEGRYIEGNECIFPKHCSSPFITTNQFLYGNTLVANENWNHFISCGSTNGEFSPSSPMQMFQYISMYDYGDISFSTCNNIYDFDTYLTIYIGDCEIPVCLTENDNLDNYASCSESNQLSYVRLTPNERQPIGTTFYIGVHSKDDSAIEFYLHVNEEQVIEPPNIQFSQSLLLENHESHQSQSTYSPTFANSLPSCSFTSLNESPVLFYEYITQYYYSDITIDTCLETNFDTILSVYLYDDVTNEYTCLIENDDSPLSGTPFTCEQTHSLIELNFDDLIPANTHLFIAIYGQEMDYFGGTVTVTVHEYGDENPINSNCESAIEISNFSTRIASVAGSSFLSQNLTDDCNYLLDPNLRTIFYSYQSSLNHSNIEINFDKIEYGSLFTMYFFTGSCDNLICEGFTSDSSVSISNLPIYTNFTFAVAMDFEVQQSYFTMNINENYICSPDGPEYNCATSFSVYTEKDCILNGQHCAVIPDFSLGECFDPLYPHSCDCTIEQLTDDIFPNAIAVAGDYPVYSIAVNEIGVQSDECSFGILVLDKCNPSGPVTTCIMDEITVTTRSICEIEGKPCGIMPSGSWASCQDNTNCKCSVSQISGPPAGSELIVGEYYVEFSSTSEFDIDASTTCRMKVNVVA